jgi:hypothetical protein
MSDSDTESEPDNSLPKCTATDFADISTQAQFHQPFECCADGVRRAVETLSSINIESVRQVRRIASAIVSLRILNPDIRIHRAIMTFKKHQALYCLSSTILGLQVFFLMKPRQMCLICFLSFVCVILLCLSSICTHCLLQ